MRKSQEKEEAVQKIGGSFHETESRVVESAVFLFVKCL